MAVERLKRCENIIALLEELGVHRRLLYKWRASHRVESCVASYAADHAVESTNCASVKPTEGE
jgi:transposase-like protein